MADGVEFSPLLPLLFQLGEGPVWSPSDRALFFVDIPAFRVQRYDWETGNLHSWRMPSEPGSAVPAEDGSIIVALRDGFYRFVPGNNVLTRLGVPDYDPLTMRLNDGRCDAAGRFWAGTMDQTRTSNGAGLWCLDRGQLRKGPHGVTLSNGLAFSPDGRFAYHADSVARIIYRYRYDLSNGLMDARETWFTVPDGLGDPDGAAVDVEGNYWIAMYGGGCLLKLGADGRLIAKVDVPVRCPTMVAFAGPDLRSLVVTSSRRNRPESELAAYPLSGTVLVASSTGAQGQSEQAYRN